MLNKFRNVDLGLLLLRLCLAYEFISHSWQKFSNISGSLKFFSHLGLPFPLFTLWLVCGVEMLGGIAMLLGIWPEIFGSLLAIDMLGVIITVRSGPMAHGILAGHDLEFTLLVVALSLAIAGAGRYALMRPKEKQILV